MIEFLLTYPIRALLWVLGITHVLAFSLGRLTKGRSRDVVYVPIPQTPSKEIYDYTPMAGRARSADERMARFLRVTLVVLVMIAIAWYAQVDYSPSCAR